MTPSTPSQASATPKKSVSQPVRFSRSRFFASKDYRLEMQTARISAPSRTRHSRALIRSDLPISARDSSVCVARSSAELEILVDQHRCRPTIDDGGRGESTPKRRSRDDLDLLIRRNGSAMRMQPLNLRRKPVPHGVDCPDCGSCQSPHKCPNPNSSAELSRTSSQSVRTRVHQRSASDDHAYGASDRDNRNPARSRMAPTNTPQRSVSKEDLDNASIRQLFPRTSSQKQPAKVHQRSASEDQLYGANEQQQRRQHRLATCHGRSASFEEIQKERMHEQESDSAIRLATEAGIFPRLREPVAQPQSPARDGESTDGSDSSPIMASWVDEAIPKPTAHGKAAKLSIDIDTTPLSDSFFDEMFDLLSADPAAEKTDPGPITMFLCALTKGNLARVPKQVCMDVQAQHERSGSVTSSAGTAPSLIDGEWGSESECDSDCLVPGPDGDGAADEGPMSSQKDAAKDDQQMAAIEALLVNFLSPEVDTKAGANANAKARLDKLVRSRDSVVLLRRLSKAKERAAAAGKVPEITLKTPSGHFLPVTPSSADDRLRTPRQKYFH